MARPQSEGDTGTTTIVGRRDKRPATAGVLLHLVFIGLIGAATVILFAVASVAFLTTIREPFTASRVDERGLPSSDPSPEPSSEQHSAPKPDLAEMRPAFAPQTALNRDEPEIAGAKTSFERPSSERTFSTTPEPPDAFPTRDRSAAPTHSTEAHDSEPMPAEPLPAADTSVIPETGPSVPPVPNPAELRDQIPGDAEFQQSQPTKLDQANPASDEKAPAQKPQNRRVSRKTVIQDADLRNRVQKECGPIIFPALRRHCVASFGIHYR